jgi:hypothetical protein
VKPTFVETLDAVDVAKTSGMPLAPVMIYGDDVTHVLTEEGIAYLYRAESLEERRAMVAAVAGSPILAWAWTPNAWPNCAAAAKWSTRKIWVFAAARPPVLAGGRQRGRPGGMVRRSLQPTCEIPELVMKLLPQIQVEGGAEWLARTATQCLIDEARLSPKPGLVDSRGNGAHHDLTLALMERSAHSLTPTFQALAQQSWQRPADIALRKPSADSVAKAKQQMMAATGGVNTHRGAIWALGLLVSAVAMRWRCERVVIAAPPPHWRNCRTPPRRKFSVKGCAPHTATAYPAREKRRSRPSRIFCSSRCRNCV